MVVLPAPGDVPVNESGDHVQAPVLTALEEEKISLNSGYTAGFPSVSTTVPESCHIPEFMEFVWSLSCHIPPPPMPPPLPTVPRGTETEVRHP